MEETIEQQTQDSEMIYKQITNGDFDNYAQAEQTVCMLYVPDMSISRSGISHALKRLKSFYSQLTPAQDMSDE